MLVLVAGAVVACSCSQRTSASPPTRLTPKSESHARAAPPASPDFSPWIALAREELVWARSDLSGPCRAPEFGSFMPEVTSRNHPHARTALAFGCRLLESATTRAGRDDELQGAAFCCPRSLPPIPSPHTGGTKSCEQAIYEYVLATPPGAHGPGPDTRVTAEQYGSVLGRGTYLARCNVPDTSTVKVCAAVRDGKLIGLTVRIHPVDVAAADCVAAGVLSLPFPSSDHLDVTRTTFEAVD